MALLISIVGFLVLSLVTLALFSLSALETLGPQGLVFLGIVKLLILVGLVYEYRLEWVKHVVKGKKWELTKADLLNFWSVVIGTVITFYISTELHLGPVVASALVGLIGALVAKNYEVPIFCGSFAGMACGVLFGSYMMIIAAGVMAGLVFVASKDVFNGFGGKLGTIAYSGCIFSIVIANRPFGVSEVPSGNLMQLLVIYSVIGAVLTFVLNMRLNHSAVISSSTVGLMGGLLLPSIYPDHGVTLGVMVFCASFAGMSSKARVSNELQMIIAGIFCALIFAYTSPYLGGGGGKLGTIAFGSCIAVRGMRDLGSYLVDYINCNSVESVEESGFGKSPHA